MVVMEFTFEEEMALLAAEMASDEVWGHYSRLYEYHFDASFVYADEETKREILGAAMRQAELNAGWDSSP